MDRTLRPLSDLALFAILVTDPTNDDRKITMLAND